MKEVEILETEQIEFAGEIRSNIPKTIFFVQTFFQTIGRILPRRAAGIAYRLFTSPLVKARHKKSDDILVQARIFEIIYGKGLLKCYEWGSGDKIILLVHGWESRGTALRSFVPSLLKKGYKVVAFDGPAHGDSDGKSTNIPNFSGAIEAVVKNLGNVEGIIAHSFGGVNSIYCLGNKKISNIQKLVLVAVPSSVRTVFRNFFNLIKAPDGVRESFIDLLENKFKQSVDHYEPYLNIAKIKDVEILIIHDEMDPVVPITSAERNFNNSKEATLVKTKGLGHYFLMKNDNVLDRVSEFFNEPVVELTLLGDRI